MARVVVLEGGRFYQGPASPGDDAAEKLAADELQPGSDRNVTHTQ